MTIFLKYLSNKFKDNIAENEIPKSRYSPTQWSKVLSISGSCDLIKDIILHLFVFNNNFFSLNQAYKEIQSFCEWLKSENDWTKRSDFISSTKRKFREFRRYRKSLINKINNKRAKKVYINMCKLCIYRGVSWELNPPYIFVY